MKLRKPTTTDTIVVYCKLGGRSAMAQNVLQRQGLKVSQLLQRRKISKLTNPFLANFKPLSQHGIYKCQEL